MKIHITLFIFLFFIALLSCGETDNIENKPSSYDKNLIEIAECTNITRPVDTYVYPVTPGSDQWKTLHSKGMDEVLKACRVPEKVLKKQSTSAVIQTFLDYPFSLHIYTSSSTLLNGFKSSVVYNDAYTELLKRKDAGKCIFQVYQLFNPIGCTTATLMSPLLELLMAQQEFYSQLNNLEKKELIKEALKKIKVRIDFDPLLVHDNETTCLLIGRVMESAKFDPFIQELNHNEKMNQYLETQSYYSTVCEIILSYADQFVK